jgi:DNA-binding NtrC family response regulator
MKSYVIFGSEEDLRAAMQNNREVEDSVDPEIPSNGVISLKTVVRTATKQLERRVILRALETHQWNRRKAARALSISYAGLLCKMRDAGMPPTRGPKACVHVGAQGRELN